MSESFIENCRRLISLDSTPDIGTDSAARFIAGLCADRDFGVELQEDSSYGVKQVNVLATAGPTSGEPELLLQTHIDTVDPGGYSLWTKTDQNPFKASIYDDRIYGLGTADSKLDILCKIEALSRVGVKNLKKPVMLLGSYGVGMGMTGILKFIRKNRVRPRLALIGEPTGLSIANEGIGFARLEVTIPFSEQETEYRQSHDLMESSSTQTKIFYGKAAHASNPGLGINAIALMLEYLSKLPDGIAIMDMEGGNSQYTVPSQAVLELDMVGSIKDSVSEKIRSIYFQIRELEKKFLLHPCEGFEPSCATLNVSQVRTLKDGVRLEGACRMPPSVSESIYMGWIEEMRNICQQAGSTFRIVDYKPPFSTSSESDFAKLCLATAEDLALGTELRKTSTVSEACVLARLGIDCILFGPGQGMGNSHAPNENVSLEELEKATEYYTHILQRVCL